LKINHKINISIQEFILSGKFDFITLGCDKAWIINNFPAPDDWSVSERFEEATIWRYGDIEFHFNENTLWLIFTDQIVNLNGGVSLNLDKWILQQQRPTKFEEIIHELNLLGVNYYVQNQVLEGRSEIQIQKSGVKLSFDAQDEDPKAPSKFELISISLSYDT